MLAVGAIGTTLLASYLAMGQFIADALCNLKGMCTVRDRSLCSVLTVALPALLATTGPTLYMPLLAFSGAFPTTVLYCVMPPLAALRLRRRGRQAADSDSAAAADGAPLSPPAVAAAPPSLLPGGAAMQATLAVAAMGLVATSLMDVAARVLPRCIARLGGVASVAAALLRAR